jgi:hypothetical protein
VKQTGDGWAVAHLGVNAIVRPAGGLARADAAVDRTIRNRGSENAVYLMPIPG